MFRYLVGFYGKETSTQRPGDAYGPVGDIVLTLSETKRENNGRSRALSLSQPKFESGDIKDNTRDLALSVTCCGLLLLSVVQLIIKASNLYVIDIGFLAEDGDRCFSDTLLCTYKSTRRYNPQDQHRHLHLRENFIT
jgi:hypothetical protein